MVGQGFGDDEAVERGTYDGEGDEVGAVDPEDLADVPPVPPHRGVGGVDQGEALGVDLARCEEGALLLGRQGNVPLGEEVLGWVDGELGVRPHLDVVGVQCFPRLGAWAGVADEQDALVGAPALGGLGDHRLDVVDAKGRHGGGVVHPDGAWLGVQGVQSNAAAMLVELAEGRLGGVWSKR